MLGFGGINLPLPRVLDDSKNVQSILACTLICAAAHRHGLPCAPASTPQGAAAAVRRMDAQVFDECLSVVCERASAVARDVLTCGRTSGDADTSMAHTDTSAHTSPREATVGSEFIRVAFHLIASSLRQQRGQRTALNLHDEDTVMYFQSLKYALANGNARPLVPSMPSQGLAVTEKCMCVCCRPQTPIPCTETLATSW